MSEYWLISAPGDKTCQQTFDTMNNLTNKQHNLCNNYKFHIPDLKVGTLDQLVGLSDDLGKLDAYVEQITRKVANYLGEVLEDQRDKLQENLLANNSPGPPDDSTNNPLRHHRHHNHHHHSQNQNQNNLYHSQSHSNHSQHHHQSHSHHQHLELTGKSSNLSNSRDITTTCSACHSGDGGGSLNNLSTTNDESERDFDYVISPVCACDECFATNASCAPPSTSATASTLVADECYSQTTSSMLNATRCAISTATAIATGNYASTSSFAAASASASACSSSSATATTTITTTNKASASSTTLSSSAFFSTSAPAAAGTHSISRSNSKKLNNNTCSINNNKMSFKSSSHLSQLSQQSQQQHHHHQSHMPQMQLQSQPLSSSTTTTTPQSEPTEESTTTSASGDGAAAALKDDNSLSDISDTFDWWFHRHKRNSKKSSKRSTTSQLNIKNGFNLTPTHRSSPVSSCCGSSSHGRSSPDTDTGELPEFPLSPADLSVYITRFQWDMAKYPIKQSLRNIADIISKQIGQIDADLKTKSSAYNNLKGNLQNLEKKKTGSLMTRNLADLVKKEHFILDSEYLTTLLVIVPKALANDWVANYEKITDMIVPRSSQLIQEDPDYCLFNVTLFKKVVEEFKLHARERKFIVRDFVYNEEELAAGKNEMTKLMTDKKKQFGPLVRWLKVNFSEAFCALVHVKALRVFVESVLRYGLPVNFQAILIEPNKKSVKRLRDTLYQLYSHLDGAAAGNLSSVDNVDIPGLGFGQAEYYPYVFYKLNIDMVESAKI